jgi:hypothetical protein
VPSFDAGRSRGFVGGQHAVCQGDECVVVVRAGSSVVAFPGIVVATEHQPLQIDVECVGKSGNGFDLRRVLAAFDAVDRLVRGVSTFGKCLLREVLRPPNAPKTLT